MEEIKFGYRECDEEDTIGFLDVEISNRLKEYGSFEERQLEGQVEWLVYYTRFFCEDTEINRKYLDKFYELQMELDEEDEEDGDMEDYELGLC